MKWQREEDRDPWARAKGESAKAYAAFSVYRDGGKTRSLAGVGRQVGKSLALMERWSARWGWVERCVAWDEHQDERKRQILIAKVETSAARHQQAAEAMVALGLSQLMKLARKVAPLADPMTNHLGETDVGALRQLIVEGAKLERLVLGEPTEVQAQRQADPWAPLIDALKEPEHDPGAEQGGAGQSGA